MRALLLCLCLGGWACAEEEAIEVTVPPGLSARATSRLLKERGVVSSSFLFRAAAKVTGAEREIKPGDYRFKRGLSVLDVLSILKTGTTNDLKLVIPEGFSARQIAERLSANGLCKADDFMALAASKRLEGYLFPTTYSVDKHWSAGQIAQRMVDEFQRRVPPLFEAAKDKPALNLHQIVTLASIVEREAVVKSERPAIASVYLNRLRKRMMLEADPTVQYGLGYWKKGLTLDDLKVSSPYNTYNHFGLPPGPICNPGLDSVEAALRPARTEAIFFVADGKGGHVFSTTLEEHLVNKAKLKRELRLQREAARRGGH
ncbi:MAG: endolytic transglycosylase MltG [Elusimicrobia bacterium]|nr:endolytic transglycosylase MltG [Elusimicrobiota bacterium]